MKKPYLKIINHYNNCLDKYGDTHLGVDWPNIREAELRYKIMLEVRKFGNQQVRKPTILDFGCGAAHLKDYIVKKSMSDIKYSGLDISPKFISLSKSKYPEIDFYCLDILENPEKVHNFDYIVMNGVFTEKRELTFDDMLNYFKKLLHNVFEKTNYGLAFNVMSKSVDWERNDLFHLPTDLLINYLVNNITRNFIIRNDYGLSEYTVYLYK